MMNSKLEIPQNSPAVILLLEDKSLLEDEIHDALIKDIFACKRTSSLDEATRIIASEQVDLLIVSTNESLNADVLSLRDLTDVYLPIMVISDELGNEVLDYYAEAEIDAVILRPVNFRLLMIKVRSSLKLKQYYMREIEQRKQLLNYWQMVDLEQEVAAKIFYNVLKSHFLETEAVKAVMSPMSLFNGDLLLVSRTPANNLHVLLGDFTGHGMPASIAAAPTAEIFSGMTKKGFAITDIVAEINTKLHKMLPANIFFAASIIALKPDSKTLNIITCGLPEHFLVDHEQNTCEVIHSLNIPLGIQDDMEIEEQIYNISGNECLYLLTDGIFEAENANGECFGNQRIIAAISQSREMDIENLQAQLNLHCGTLDQKDDFAIVRVLCDVENVPWRDQMSLSAHRQVAAVSWKSMMEFDQNLLRILNPVPLLVNNIMETLGLHDYRQAIFMIISELFSNALDHGILGLDSKIKAKPEGFMQFYAMKEERLRHCTNGKIRFLFSHKPTEQGGQLRITVLDTGSGFNWERASVELAENQELSGRGLKLVETLCSTLTFRGKGNLVTAVFDWRR